VYPGYGPDHGFSATLSAGGGPHTVCVSAVNVGDGSDTALGCRSTTVSTGPPFGSLDVVTTAIGSVTVRGWAIDPDTTSPITVHVYIDGGAVALTANGNRPDVGQAHPLYGSNHGYSATLAAGGGSHTVCAYGINVGAGTNPQLGCRSVTVPGGSPFGSLDSVRRNIDGSISVSGWSIDPDTATPINVLAYVAGNGYPLTGVQATASLSRPDVGAAYPQYGAPHGYTATVGSFTPSGVSVCVYGVNVGLGSTSVLDCRIVP
jgi:hypothetical protein